MTATASNYYHDQPGAGLTSW